MRIKQKISFRAHTIWLIVGILVMAGFYSYVCSVQKKKNPQDTTVPNITQLINGWKTAFTPTVNEIGSLFAEEGSAALKKDPAPIVSDAKATYWTLFLSMLFGAGIAVFIGVLMGCVAPVEAMFHWPLALLSCIPPTALLAVFMVLSTMFHWSQQVMFIGLVSFGIIPTLTKSIYLAVRDDLSDDDINNAYTLGASNYEVITKIVFPQITPRIIDGVRLTIGPAMVYIIAVEYYLGQVGFGYQLRMRSRQLDMSVVYVYLSILAISGLVMTESLVILRRRLCPWFDIKKD